MKHRSDVRVDGMSTAKTTGPKHRGTVSARRAQALFLEERAYTRWCRSHGLDPQDTESMIAYEGAVGWLYIDEPEDHR